MEIDTNDPYMWRKHWDEAIQQRDEARAEVERLKDKLENQEEISRDLYYERGLLKSEVEHLKQQFIPTGFDEWFTPTYTRQEPSRLEIAAMAMQGFIASSGFIIDIPKTSLEYADALIAAAREAK